MLQNHRTAKLNLWSACYTSRIFDVLLLYKDDRANMFADGDLHLQEHVGLFYTNSLQTALYTQASH